MKTKKISTKAVNSVSVTVCWPQSSVALSPSTAVVLNLWVETHLGVKQLFHGGHLRPWENTDMCITAHNSSKFRVVK